jgi:hypothetical protein
MVIIDTQAKFNAAARKIDFCYLCGEPLKLITESAAVDITREHVIPRAVLDEEERTAEEMWPIVLHVHGRCEADYKRKNDHFSTVFQRLNSTPSSAWNVDECNYLFKRISMETVRLGNKSQPVINGVSPAIDAMLDCARGLHSLLFTKFVSDEATVRILAPVPAVADDVPISNEEQLRDWLEGHMWFEGLIAESIRHGLSSSVILAGGRVRFDCAFVQMDEGAFWIWQFQTGLTKRWSEGVCGVGVPWIGVIEVPNVPESCEPVPLAPSVDS